jgi:ribonuclease E
MRELDPPAGLGFIIRTAGIDRSRKDLQRDMHYLLRLWRTIVRRIQKQPAPIDIYEESDMVIRTIRDIYSADIQTIWVDEPSAYERIREFMQVVLPKQVDTVKLYEGKEPIFTKHHVEEEIARIQERRVPLPGGGSLVIDQTEALVAIDVNSGTFRADDDAEETAYQVNLRAAEEVARQIRLRDLGGVIVIDFIDMREERHRRNVERRLYECVERDRARTKVLRISRFGLVEMTRQRIRPSLKRSAYEACPCCSGTGHVKTAESMAIEVMRSLMTSASLRDVKRVDVEVSQRVADYLINRKRRDITQLEEQYDVIVNILTGLNVGPEHLKITCRNAAGVELNVPTVKTPR